MRSNVISRAVSRIRGGLGRFWATSWLIGGEEAQSSHTLRQGLLAALMIMVGSWGVGWLATTPTSLFATHPFFLPLRTTTTGVVICTVLLTFGSLLLLRSWLRLSQRVGGWRREATPIMYKALAMWGGPMLLAFPFFSRDVFSYMAQGQVLHHGMNPYETGVSEVPGWFMAGADGLWAESPSPYGPLFLVVAQFFWFVSGTVPEVAILLFRLLSVLGVLLIAVFASRLARSFGSEPSWAIWLCLLNPLSLIVFLGAGHNDAIMTGLMVAGCWYALRRRRLVAILLLVAAIAVKPIAMVVLPFVILLTLDDTRQYLLRFREWAVAAVLGAAMLIGAGYALGVGIGWVDGALDAGSAIAQTAPVGLLGTGIGALVELSGGAETEEVAAWVYTGARAVAAVVLAVMLLRSRLGNPVLWAAYGMTVVVLSSSIIQPWYFLWILPLFAVVHIYRGRVLIFVSLLLTVLVLLGVVGQLSVVQWVDISFVQSIAVAVAVLYLVYIIFFDPNTAEIFDVSRDSQRWNAADGWLKLRSLSTPDISWRRKDIFRDAGRGTAESRRRL